MELIKEVDRKFEFLLIMTKERAGFMLWSIIVLLIILWLLGFSFHIGGGLVHLLLVIALIILIIRLITGGRAP